MSLSRLFLFFIVYSVLGWVCEVVWCSFLQRKFVNRGFLHGPLCPVYGFGGLLVIFLLQPFAGNPFYLFSMAVVVTSILEYVTGWLLESIFATKWWDYSGQRFNIHGRVCLLNSLIFGALGTVGVLVLHPFIQGVVSRVPSESQDILAGIFALILAIDLVFTLRALVDFQAKLASLTEFMGSVKDSLDVREWFNELDLPGSLERLRAKASPENSELNRRLIASLESITTLPREMARLLSAFPGMRSLRHGLQLDLFRNLHSRGTAGWKKLKKALPEVSVASLRFNAAPDSPASAVAAAPLASDTPVSTAAAATAAGSRDAAEDDEYAVPAGQRIYEFLWVFIIASYIGVILESFWCVVTNGHLESRTGLIYGMLNPVYGAGAVLMSIAFLRYRKRHDLVVFVGSMLIGGGFEYLCSLGQQLAFNSYSWEYSQTQLNLHGRTNLMFSLIWGFLGLVWVRYIFPVLVRLIRRIPKRFGRIFAILFTVALSANILISGAAVHRWSERTQGVAPANAVEAFIDDHYPDAMMKDVFPNMRFYE